MKFLILLRKEIKELLTVQMLAPLIAVMIIFIFIGNIINTETQKTASSMGFAVADLDHSSAAQEAINVLQKSFSGVPVIVAENIDNALAEAKKENVLGLLAIPQGFGAGLEQNKQQRLDIYSVISNLSFAQTRKSQIIGQASAIINNYFSDKLISSSANSANAQFYKAPVIPNEYVIIGDKMANISFAQVSGFISSQTFFVPIILFLVIVLASQLVATTIATEKENKTLETLLSMPVSRKSIALAKLVASAVVALLSAGIYLYGLQHYISGITAGTSGATSESVKQAIAILGLNFSTFGFMMLGISLFLGILAALAIALVLGAFVEDAKSVQGVTTPLMILIFIPYLLTIFVDLNSTSPVLRYLVYAIPFSHSFLASSNILFHRYLLYVLGNIYLLVFFTVAVIVASKIFSSDKILTLKLKFRVKKTS